MSGLIKVIFVNTLIILSIVIIFDAMTFNYMPYHYVERFPGYRFNKAPDVVGRVRYPKGYFVEHEERGFEIGKSQHGFTHWVSGSTYPIWSNSFGCFDHEPPASSSYVYFAGDSFTWGYAPFDQKFGTIIERVTGTTIFKCGVSHTGQIHQFEKFVDIVEQVGRQPEAVFVFYYLNDVVNDYAYPHTIVIQGWQIDSVSLDENYELIRHSRQKLEQVLADRLNRLQLQRERERQAGWWTRAKYSLMYYSLSTNILKYALDRASLAAGLSAQPNQRRMGEMPAYNNLYYLPSEKNGRFWYLDNPKAQRNKAALLSFSRYSEEHKIDLIVVLLPWSVKPVHRNWYAELRDFLAQNHIRYIDLTQKFIDQGLQRKDLKWAYDGHFSPSGNKFVAEALMDEFPRIFRHENKTR
jgi:hypothetical protein